LNRSEQPKPEIDDAPQRMEAAALAYLKQGYCCSEAILMAATERFLPASDVDAQAIAGGLCGGMGNHKVTCGVFTGGASAIGLVLRSHQGRHNKAEVRKLAGRFQQQLERHAGGHVCEQLLEQMGWRNWNKQQCHKLTGDGTRLLGELLQEVLADGDA